ncbi:MAG: hypothetical protein IPM51_05735 [Sphingobacteriaceae bacterium]|nr:hypothetical protein [Sphingobacteriaceae bacterium]
MYLKRFIQIACLCLVTFKVLAQPLNSSRYKKFTVISDTLILDTLSLVPGTIQYTFFPQLDSSQLPEINYKSHALVFHKGKPDSFFVSYKAFPLNLEKKYFHRDAASLYTDLSRPNNPFIISYTGTTKQDQLFLNDGLNKNGNISRGLSFGNTQDVVVNSNLNLQVSGKLTPEIDLVMAATDNNIPFQADGTTAQLQEFDKVFIQLSTKDSKMIVGDYQLAKPQNSHFMKFYKRAQGIYFENVYADSSDKNPVQFNTRLAGAVSRGKFSRQVFFGTENNQGPYRLRGADNEPFIIVLSGTEKIFIDGKLLQRGQENDYIIDYNTGEITFTAKQFITKDKRIVAEFQYAERNYARSLFHFGEEVSVKKTKVYFNFFSEQDNKSRPLQQTLEQDQKNTLIRIGDSLEKAVYTGVQEAEFNTSDVFYRKLDSTVNLILYPDVYVYSTIADSAKYRLKFSNVGQGNGNYIQITSSANGKVYKWIAPINGLLQGAYEPVIPLITPKQHQMVTGGITHSITQNNVLNVEGVYTRNDINTFSKANKENDEGSGVKIGSKNEIVLKKDTLHNNTKFVYNLNYEFLQKQFTQVERFRSVEFERDWNRPLGVLLVNDQHIGNVEMGLVKSSGSALLYNYNLFSEGTNYLGEKHQVTGKYYLKKFASAYSGSLLNSKDQLIKQGTEFYRHKSNVSQIFGKVKLAYTDEFERNLFSNINKDTLQARAYQFWEWESSISNADSSKNRIKLFYKERQDKLNYGNELKDSTLAKNYGLSSSIYSIKNNPISLIITYRTLELKNVVGTFLKPDNTLLSRLEYNPRYFKGFITAGIFYESGYGLENKKEFYYLEVAPGQGQYAWIDYNKNDIKELNEFEIAQYNDQARFIRIFTPTNEYVKVLQNLLSVSFNIRPSTIIRNPKTTLAKFARIWMFQTAVRLDNKTADNKDLNNYNPLFDVHDTVLIANTRNLRQSVFLNQSSAVFGMDYTYTDNNSRQLLLNGFEDRSLFSHEIRDRINILKSWAINNLNTYSRKGNRSQFFSNRNYMIETFETESKLIFQNSTNYRIAGIYKYSEKRNIYESANEKAIINNVGLEIRFNQTEKGSLNARADYILINYNSDANSPVSFEMLNSLNKGENYTWELVYSRNLSTNIQMSINYNGRKSPGTSIVHIGGAQIRAFF